MLANGRYKGIFQVGTWVRISSRCPFRATFPRQVGRIKKIIGDQIGLMWVIRLRSGEDVYLRRAELELFWKEDLQQSITLGTSNYNFRG